MSPPSDRAGDPRPPGAHVTGNPDAVLLQIPARADLLILPRLLTAAVGSRAELAIDDIDDLRLAVDELCLSVMGQEGSGSLSLEITTEPGVVEVSCVFHPFDDARGSRQGDQDTDRLDGALPELSSRILDALVDEHTYERGGSAPRARFRKVATPQGSAVSSADPRPSA